jgi:hypothetical protein
VRAHIRSDGEHWQAVSKQVLARQDMESSELTASKGCKQLKEDNYERTSQNMKERLPKVLAPNNT